MKSYGIFNEMGEMESGGMSYSEAYDKWESEFYSDICYYIAEDESDE